MMQCSPWYEFTNALPPSNSFPLISNLPLSLPDPEPDEMADFLNNELSAVGLAERHGFGADGDSHCWHMLFMAATAPSFGLRDIQQTVIYTATVLAALDGPDPRIAAESELNPRAVLDALNGPDLPAHLIKQNDANHRDIALVTEVPPLLWRHAL